MKKKSGIQNGYLYRFDSLNLEKSELDCDGCPSWKKLPSIHFLANNELIDLLLSGAIQSNKYVELAYSISLLKNTLSPD